MNETEVEETTRIALERLIEALGQKILAEVDRRLAAFETRITDAIDTALAEVGDDDDDDTDDDDEDDDESRYTSSDDLATGA